jgi:predicted transcriptional regulator YheO
MISKEEFFDFLKKMASLIADTFGNSCEVAISDLNSPESTIIEIINNHVTGRSVGDPLVPQALERIRNSADGYYINYRDSKSGKALKTSTVTFENKDLNVAFCINYDCADFEKLNFFLSNFLAMQTEDSSISITGSYAPVIEDAVREGIAVVGKPVRFMNKKDRLQVIEYIESRGVLKMQKGVQAVAQYLGISRYTVYNYLNELNENKEQLPPR